MLLTDGRRGGVTKCRAITHLPTPERGTVVFKSTWRRVAAVAAGSLAITAAGASLGGLSSAFATQGTINGTGSVNAPQTLQLGIGGLLMTDLGKSHSPGAVVDFEQPTVSNGQTQASQLWQFLPDSNDITTAAFTANSQYGLLKNTESGLCLEVPSQRTDVGVPLDQTTCNSNAAGMKWKAVPQSGGGYAIKASYGNVYAGFNKPYCAQVGPANSDQVVTKDADTLVCGTWQVTEVLPHTGVNKYFWADTRATQSLDSRNLTGDWGVSTGVTYGPNSTGKSVTATQQWQVQQVGYKQVTFSGGVRNMPVYRLVSVPNGDWTKATCLEAPGAVPAVGAQIDTYGCDPNWIFQPNELWMMFDDPAFTSIPHVGLGYGDVEGALVNLATANPSTAPGSWPVVTFDSSYGRVYLGAPSSSTDNFQYQAWLPQNS